MRFQLAEQTLEVVKREEGADAVIVGNSLPALTGNGSDDLICGGCGSVVAAKLTTAAIARSFKTERRLILECTCGASNLIAPASEEESDPN